MDSTSNSRDRAVFSNFSGEGSVDKPLFHSPVSSHNQEEEDFYKKKPNKPEKGRHIAARSIQ